MNQDKTGPKRVECFICKRTVTKRKTKAVEYREGGKFVRVCRTHPTPKEV